MLCQWKITQESEILADPSFENERKIIGSWENIGSWDQFAQKGIKASTYSDELYTTSLSDKDFTPAQLQHAERVAKELAVRAMIDPSFENGMCFLCKFLLCLGLTLSRCETLTGLTPPQLFMYSTVLMHMYYAVR